MMSADKQRVSEAQSREASDLYTHAPGAVPNVSLEGGGGAPIPIGACITPNFKLL